MWGAQSLDQTLVVRSISSVLWDLSLFFQGFMGGGLHILCFQVHRGTLFQRKLSGPSPRPGAAGGGLPEAPFITSLQVMWTSLKSEKCYINSAIFRKLSPQLFCSLPHNRFLYRGTWIFERVNKHSNITEPTEMHLDLTFRMCSLDQQRPYDLGMSEMHFVGDLPWDFVNLKYRGWL